MNGDGFSRAEIAQAAGCTETNVRLRLKGVAPIPDSQPKRYRLLDLPPEWRAVLQSQAPSGDPLPPDAPGTADPHPAAAPPAGGDISASAPPAAPSSRGPALAGPEASLVNARVAVLQAWETWRAGRELTVWASQIAFCTAYNAGEIAVDEAARAAIPSLSWSTLQRFRRALKASGLAGLADKRRRPCMRAKDLFDEYLAAAAFEYRHITADKILKGFVERHPEAPPPALRTAQARLARFVAENAAALSAVTDPDGHRSRRQPAFGDAAAGVARYGERQEWDSSPKDLICIEGRGVIVARIDIATREPKVLVAPTSSSEAICALMRRDILEDGVPEEQVTDEGSDYTSIRLMRVRAALGIRHKPLPPYTPEGKPHIERYFRTLFHDLFETLPGYCGHSVAEAQKLRERKSFAQRRGEDDREAFSVQLSFAEVQRLCDAWNREVYMHRPHKGLQGRTPFEAKAACRAPRRRLEDERALDILLAEAAGGGHGIRTVSKHGLHVEGTVFIAAELGALVGERVHVRMDPADMGRVWVFDPSGERFLCEAVAAERAGLDRREIAIEAKRRYRAAAKHHRAEARRLKARHEPHHIAADIARGAAGNAQVVAFPAPRTAHETPYLQAAREAAERRDEDGLGRFVGGDGAARDPSSDLSSPEPPASLAEPIDLVDLAAERARAEAEEAERLRAEAKEAILRLERERQEREGIT